MESKVLNVAFFCDGLFPFQVGGIQRHSTEMIRELIRLNTEIHVFFPPVDASLAVETLNANFGNAANLHFHPVKFPRGLWYPGHYIVRSWLFSRNLFRDAARMEKFDFIYAQGFTGWYAGKYRARVAKETPIGVNLHGLNMFQPVFGFYNRIRKYFLQIPARACIHRSNVVFSLGGKLSEIIRHIRENAHIVEIPTGVTTDWIVPERGSSAPVRRFLFVGRKDPIKALDKLLAAFKEIRSRYTGIELHIVGDTTTGEPENGIFWHGAITDPEKLKQVYAGCDVLVCPSYSEGMPIVVCEAMASGLLVIASATGAVTELVDDSTGVLVKPGVTADICAAMEKLLLAETVELTTMRNQAIARIRSAYTWPVIASQTMDVIKMMSSRE